MTVVYEDSGEHLRDELARLDARLRAYLERWWQERNGTVDEFRGLYIPDAEVDDLLRSERTGSTGTAREALAENGTDGRSRATRGGRWDDASGRLGATITDRVRASLAAGVDLRLPALGARFDLDRSAIDLLVFALAPELDRKYDRVYAYLQDDITRRRPSVGLALEVLLPDERNGYRMRSLLADSSPLVTDRLVRLSGPEGATLLDRELSVDESLVSYLLGADGGVGSGLRVLTPTGDVGSLPVEASTTRALHGVVAELERTNREADRDLLVYLHGPPGSATRPTVEAVCATTDRRVLAVDVDYFGEDPDEALALVRRAATLHDAILLVERVDSVTDGDRSVVLTGLDRIDGPVFLTGERRLGGVLRSAFDRHRPIEVELPRPSYHLGRELWAATGLPAGVDPAELAARFRFTPGQVHDALETARSLAIVEGEPGEITPDRVYAACRAQTDEALGSLARKVRPHYTWDDIVLPAERLAHLREVAAYVDQRGRVYHDWGFDEKFSLGKGLVVLFTGPSGTGKTMAADIVAGEAGLDLYRVDLSGVVSKYIGETEKNLGRIFDEAAGSNAILLFDEADALFGKRSEVSDAHDRYANIEVNYLLQRIEEYDGAVVLTTNFDGNIDDAFRRRIHVSVEFPLPDGEARRTIWEEVFPERTPVEELDVEFLASLKLTGGNIKNAALTAAVLAADAGESVGMEHVLHAARRELQKNGTLVDPARFEEYRARLDEGEP